MLYSNCCIECIQAAQIKFKICQSMAWWYYTPVVFIGAVESASVALVQQFRELLNMHNTIDLLSSVL